MPKLVVLLTLLSISSFAIDMVGDDLINFFSSTCRTQGEYTRQALNDSRSLINILENLKNDEDCVTISGGISQLGNLQRKLNQIDSKSSLNIEIEKLTNQENELLIQLSLTTDPALRSDINTTLNQIQKDKAIFVSELSARDRVLEEDVTALYTNIVNTTNSVFNTISNNYRCLNKNPEILPAITSFAGAISNAALTVNPALGLGVAAATDFIGHTVEAFRIGRYNRMIRKISDSGMALEGYKCVLESLSDRWCSLQDAQDFLNLKASIRREDNDESGYKSAIRLQDRDIPVLLDWLGRVRTGIPPATEADATRQRQINNREAFVRSAAARGNGVISENRPLFEAATSPQDKWTVVRNIISALTPANCGGGGNNGGGGNPLRDIHPASYSPFFLLGLDTIPTQGGFNIEFCDFDPFNQWPNGTYEPSLEILESRYEQWIEAARRIVQREFTLILQPDALQVLSTAYEETSNKWKFSTISSLDNLIQFLSTYSPSSFRGNSFQSIYESTLESLKLLKSTIEGGIIGDTFETPKEALEEVFRIAKLQYGVVVFRSRLEMIVRVSVKQYIDTLEDKDTNNAAQLLAAESFLDVLTKVSGTDNLALIGADIQRAMPIAIGNMTSFLDVFGNNINRILKKNAKNMARTNDSRLNEIYQRNSAEICLLLSSMPSWPKQVDQRYCVGSQLGAVIPNGPTSPILTKNFLKEGFTKRNCGYRNYLRKSRIYQEWGINL